jgi:hypothetical protein
MAKKIEATRPTSDLDSIIDAEFETLTDLSKHDTKVSKWYSWGIYALNYISTKNMYNGVPAGRISSLKGLSGTGKSLLLASLSKDPKIDKIIAIGSEGGGLSAELFEFTGVPLDKIRISQYATFGSYKISKKNGKIEEVSDSDFPAKTDTDEYRYVEGATRFIKRFVNAVEFKGIKSNIVVMLDSLANMKSVREIGGTSDMGARAKDINTFFGIFDNAFERTNIAFVFTNKLYMNFGNKYVPWIENGGEGAIYNPSLSLWLSDSSIDTRDKTAAEADAEKDRRKTALGSSLKLIKAKVDKSRFGTELRNIDFLIDMSAGPVRLSGLFQLCEDFGVLVKSGNNYTIPGVIDKSFYKKDFISILSADEENLIGKLQTKFEEAEARIKSAKQNFQASDLDDIPEETDLSDIKKQMAKDLEA